MPTTPVPIVMLNQLGEKLRTTRRHPWSFLESDMSGRSELGIESFSGCSLSGLEDALRRWTAGMVTAGLSID